MMSTENRLCFMIDLHKSGSHGCITNRDRAEAGLQMLIAAGQLFGETGNKRTAERVRAAISSARGAVRMQTDEEFTS